MSNYYRIKNQFQKSAIFFPVLSSSFSLPNCKLRRIVVFTIRFVAESSRESHNRISSRNRIFIFWSEPTRINIRPIIRLYPKRIDSKRNLIVNILFIVKKRNINRNNKYFRSVSNNYLVCFFNQIWCRIIANLFIVRISSSLIFSFTFLFKIFFFIVLKS